VPVDEHQEAIELTVMTMTSAFALNVPLEVNIATGPSWAEAKG
jgi:DNA polymerase I-like protein with 3'-5' exonuclease and polymerase domains